MRSRCVLFGFKGSGKTTYGKLLAERLQRSFFDTDELLRELYLKQKGQHLTVREIYNIEKEESFREWEHKAVFQLKEVRGAIIALGGGTPLLEKNCTLLKQEALWVFIDTDKSLLEQRCPPFWMTQYDIRRPIYENLADVHFRPLGGTAEDETERLIQVIYG